jgi:hypothetical protein
MKNMVQIQTLLLLAFFISLPFALLSQDEEKKEKKVRVKTIKKVDGEKIVKDTTFVVSGEDDVKTVVKKMTIDAEGDSTADVMVDVMVDVDEDVEWTSDKGKKVIIIKEKDGTVNVEVIEGEDGNVYVYKSDDGDEIIKKKIVIRSPHGHHKVIKFKSEDGEEYEFDYDYDFDFDMEEFHEDMEKLKAEMKEIHVEILDEHGHLHDELIDLREFEELEELKNMEVIVVPPKPPHPHHNEFIWHHRGGMEVTDEELREAGIKNKPDRLELDEIDINKEEGVVDLSFSLMEEGAPRVSVYNVYGDKVFSGKPELMNNKYQIKMDLSKKQYGIYYVMIVVGNSSKTMRLEL